MAAGTSASRSGAEKAGITAHYGTQNCAKIAIYKTAKKVAEDGRPFLMPGKRRKKSAAQRRRRAGAKAGGVSSVAKRRQRKKRPERTGLLSLARMAAAARACVAAGSLSVPGLSASKKDHACDGGASCAADRRASGTGALPGQPRKPVLGLPRADEAARRGDAAFGYKNHQAVTDRGGLSADFPARRGRQAGCEGIPPYPSNGGGWAP